MWLIRQWKLILTILVAGFLFSRIESAGDLWAAVTRTSWVALVAAVLIHTADRLLMTYKWLRLLSLGGVRLPLLDGMKIYCASQVWGQFLPASVGTDLVRAYSTARFGAPVPDVLTSIAVERLAGTLATAGAAACGLLLLRGVGNVDAHLQVVWWLSGGLVVAVLLVLIAASSPRLFGLLRELLIRSRFTARAARVLEKLQRVADTYRKHPWELMLFMALTAFEQLAGVAITLVLVIGMGLDVPLIYPIAAVPIAFLFARMPVSLGGLGVYEGALALVMLAGGVSVAESLVLSLSMRATEVVSWLPWWLMYSKATGSLGRPRVEEASVSG